MFEIQNYGSFIIAIVLFQLIPGAATRLAGVALIGFGIKLAFHNR